MKNLLLLLCIVAGSSVVFSCRSPDTLSTEKTDLGSSGNLIVARDFSEYQRKDGGCIAPIQSQVKRVMVTGFGLFQGADYNISGSVAEAMATPQIWSGIVDRGTSRSPRPAETQFASVTSSQEAFGGKTSIRRISVNGHLFDVCFLKLDVRWDLAAAIIIYESGRFFPDMIVMSGRGADSLAHFETGALNTVMQFNGFAGNGDPLGDQNVPVEAGIPILPSHPPVQGAPHKVWMTWNNLKLRTAVTSKIAALGFGTTSETDARQSNIYICNNVSYAVLSALKGEVIELAGQQIRLQLAPTPRVPAGFFHYPISASNTADSLRNWSDVLAIAMDAQLY